MEEIATVYLKLGELLFKNSVEILFAHDLLLTLQIKFLQVSTITKEEIEDFLKQNTFNLKPSQGKVSFPIIERIYRRLAAGNRFDSIQTNDGFVVNGHHRYICLSKLGIEVATTSGGKNISEGKNFNWNTLEVEPEDYDNDQEKLDYENRYDR